MNINETQSVLDSIRRIVRALRVASRETERNLGLSSAQLYVLQKLASEHGVSVNELAALTLTHQSSVSVVVGKLVEAGLVERKKSPRDARRVEISLTAKGRSLVRRAPEPVQKRLITAIQGLPPGPRATLASGLAQIVQAAGLSAGPAPLFFEEKSR
jgi:DNA-binding MarR family transcriptional regulator